MLAINLFIDPKNPNSSVNVDGWKLLVFDNEKRLKTKVPQEDNSFTVQSKGMQVNYFHEVEGIYSQYWRIVITFREIDVQLAMKKKDNYEVVPPGIYHLNTCGKLITSVSSSLKKTLDSKSSKVKSPVSRMEQRYVILKWNNKLFRMTKFSYVKLLQLGGQKCLSKSCCCEILDGTKKDPDWTCQICLWWFIVMIIVISVQMERYLEL